MSAKTLLLLLLGLALGLPGATARAQDAESTLPREIGGYRLLYVPVDSLDAVIARDARGVFLPQDEFRKLVEAARTNSEAVASLPRTAVLSDTRYRAEIRDDQLVVTVTSRIQTHHGGWTDLKLPIGGLSIESVQINDGPAAVSRDGENKDLLHLFLDKAGIHPLKLVASAPLVATGSDRAVGFSLLPAASAEMTVSAPAQRFLTVDGQQLQRPGEKDQAAEYVFPVGGRERIQLTFTGRQATDRKDALTLANTAFGLRVTPGDVTWSASTRIQVFGRALNRLTCVVPKKLEITRVDSTGLEAWELTDTPDSPGTTTITLNYRQPIEGDRTITFQGVVQVEPGKPWEVPTLEIEGVASHVGIVRVEFPQGVRVRTEKTAGVRQMSEEDLAKQAFAQTGPASDQRLAFQVWKPDFQLSFSTEAKARELQAAVTNLLTFTETGIDMIAVGTIETRFAPLFEVQVSVPAAWQILATQVDGQTIDHQMLPSDAGTQLIRIPLPAPLLPGQTRTVQISTRLIPETWPPEETEQRLPLPEIRFPQAGVVEGLYGIGVAAGLDVVPAEVVGLDLARANDLEILRQKFAALSAGLRHGFTYQDGRAAGQLTLKRQPPRLTASTRTYVRLERTSLFSHIESDLTLQGGGARRLSLTLPESAGTDLRFQVVSGTAAAPTDVVPVIEQTSSEPVNGLRTWSLRFDRFLVGPHLLTVDLRTPKPAGVLTAPVLSVLSAERESGYVAIEAAEEQFLTIQAVDANGRPLPGIDPVDMPAGFYAPQERVVSAFFADRGGWQVGIQEQRFGRTAIPTAVVHQARLASVLEEDTRWQHQAEVVYSAVGIQSLKITMPAAELWGATIDGHAVEIRRRGNDFVVPHDPAGGEAQHTLKLLYRSARTESDPVPDSNRIVHHPPVIQAIDGAGREQPLEALQQSWTLHYPRDLALVESHGTFRPQGELHSLGWLDGVWRMLRRQAPRNVPSMLTVAALIFGAAFLLRWIFSLATTARPNWRYVGIAAGSLLVLGMCFLMLLPAVQQSREAARRSSLATTASPKALPQAHFEMDVDIPAKPVTEELARPRQYSEPAADGAMFGGVPGGQPMPPPPPSPESPVPQSAAPKDFLSEFKAEIRDESRSMIDRKRNVVAPRGGAEPANGPAAPSSIPSIVQTAPQRPSDAPQASPPGPPAATPAPVTPEEAEGTVRWRKSGKGFANAAGLLSLNASLTIPPDSASVEFSHRGEDGVSGGSAATTPALDVRYQRRDQVRAGSWFVAAVILFLTWLLRRWRGPLLLATLLLIVLPIALAPVAPATAQEFLDGACAGGIGGLLLLALVRAVPAIAGWRPTRLAKTVFPLAIGGAALLSLLGGEARAQDADVDRQALVVPYNGEDPLTAFRVFLPQETYLKLSQQAKPTEASSEPAPLEATISEALYVVTSAPGDNPSALVKARFLLEGFRKHQIRLPLPFEGGAIQSAVLDGAPAPLAVDGARPVLILDKPGRHVLDVEFRTALETTGPAGRIAVKLHPVPAARLTFELPTPDLEFRLTGSSGQFRKGTVDGKTVVEAPVDQGGEIALAWQPKQVKGIDSAIVQVESSTIASFDDAGLQSSHAFGISVRQGTISDLVFSLPAEMSLKKLRGDDVSGWETNGEGADRTLKVFFRQPIDRQTRIVVELFRTFDADAATPLTVPEVAPRDVSRDSGQVGLFTTSSLGLRVREATGVVQTDAGKFQPAAELARPEGTPQTAYRFSARPARIVVEPFRRPRETTVTAEHGVRIGLRKQLIASLFHLDIGGTPQGSVSFELPKDFLVIDVESETPLADWYTAPAAADALPILTVEFATPRTGKVSLALQGKVTLPAEGATMDIRVPRPLDATRTTAAVGVWFDDLYSASLRTLPDPWRPLPSEQAPAGLRQLHAAPVQFAFRSTKPEAPAVTFDIARSVPQLSGDSITLTAVSNSSIDHGITLRWKISRAATDTFQFITPLSLENRLQFTDSRIRQVTSSRIETGLRWTVILNEPVRDQFLLSGVATLPPAADETVVFPSLVMEVPNATALAVPLETQRHFGVLVNLSNRQLAPVNPQQIRSVTRSELPFRIEDTLLEQAMEVVELPAAGAGGGPVPQWKSQRAEEVQTNLASVTGTELVTVFNHDGSWRTRAEYTIRSRGQQFLGLRLPPASRILAAVVNGRPARTVRTQVGGADAQLVPLPATNVSDLSLRLVLILAGHVGGPFEDAIRPRAQSFDIPAPHVLSRTDSAEFGMTVAQTLWTVYVPDDFRVTPIENSPRTNVAIEEAEEFAVSSELLNAQRQLTDVLDLLRVSNSSTVSAVQRDNSRSNLKQIDLSLQQIENKFQQFRGEGRERYLEFFEGNRAVIEQAQQAAQQGGEEAPSQQQDSQSFILSNTVRLNAANDDFGGIANGTVRELETEQKFRFAVPQTESGKEKAAAKKGDAESSRGKLRSQIANQSQIDLSYQKGQAVGQQPGSGGNAQPPGVSFEQSQDRKPQWGDAAGMAGGRSRPISAGGGIELDNFSRQNRWESQAGSKLDASKLSTLSRGMGGGGFASDLSPLMDQIQQETAGTWTEAGGLSLKFDLPTAGQTLHFSKIGGSPKLAIAARPRRAWDLLAGSAWTLVWLGLAALLVVAARRMDVRRGLLAAAPYVLAAIGAACYLLLPGDERVIGIAIWLAVAVWIVSTALPRTAE
ncbi:hypothetical protein [Planctomyces sp. SH-PL14]|uniref:hypothetical protein n=1 Tax=Planctomyces sp. SH-PL14 TaxID=1632864 RepID=UPI00078D7474|nr:hypothetical protein [Planctomyces sp. SH-PL14]AMV21663.1 hypothetical protein VT03_27415 [Planctomyces sp. SH-PL14]